MAQSAARHSRWGAAAFLAPAAAVVLAGSMSWATSHTPVTDSVPASDKTVAVTPPSLDQTQLAAQRAREIAKLRKQVRALNRQLARTGAKPTSSASTRVNTGAGSSVSSRTGTGSSSAGTGHSSHTTTTSRSGTESSRSTSTKSSGTTKKVTKKPSGGSSAGSGSSEAPTVDVVTKPS